MPLPDDLVRENDGGNDSGGGNETANPPTMEEGGTPVPVRDSETGQPLNEAARDLGSATDTPSANASGQSNVNSAGNVPPSEGGEQPSPEDVDSASTIGQQIEKARQEALQIQEELKSQASQVREEEGSADPGSGLTASSRESRQRDERARRQVETLTAPDSGVASARNAYENVLNTLDQQMDQVDQRAEMRTAEIAQSQNQEIRETEQTQEREEARTRSNLIRSGGYLGGSASSQAVLKRMSDTHRQEIASLEAQKASAISEAQRAFMQERSTLAREMAQQAANMEQTINQRRQQFFDNVLQISQEKRQQEQLELDEETQKLNNAQTRAKQLAPSILDNVESLEDEDAKQEAIQGYAEKYDIDEAILRGHVEERRSTELANQLDRQNTRSLIRSRRQEMLDSEDGDSDSNEFGAGLEDIPSYDEFVDELANNRTETVQNIIQSEKGMNFTAGSPAEQTLEASDKEILKNNDRVRSIYQQQIKRANATAGNWFTSTQISEGASNANMDIAEFRNLPADEANEFITGEQSVSGSGSGVIELQNAVNTLRQVQQANQGNNNN